MKAAISFELHTWWHAGTGRGDGTVADAVVMRTAEGLPVLAGRTVKGLVRAAVNLRVDAEADVGTATDVEVWFGSRLIDANPDNRERQLEDARFRTSAGCLRFGSAELGDNVAAAAAWRAWAAWFDHRGESAERDDRVHLFSRFASTKVEADGTAADHTLRTIELCAPLTLYAPIDGLDARSARALRESLPLLRALGSHRHRGLGRVTATLLERK